MPTAMAGRSAKTCTTGGKRAEGCVVADEFAGRGGEWGCGDTDNDGDDDRIMQHLLVMKTSAMFSSLTLAPGRQRLRIFFTFATTVLMII